MNKLSANHIMLLFDIYRGTDTQFVIGTYKKDQELLCALGLVIPSDVEPDFRITSDGDLLVQYLILKTETFICKP